MSRVAIVSLGRSRALGEVRRVASWRAIFAAAGAEPVELSVAADRRPHLDGVVPALTGHAAPERLAWSGRRLHDELHAVDPAVVVVVTTRAYDAHALDGPWVLVLDHVDSLARSYADRATIVPGVPRRTMYRALGALHRRTERTLARADLRRVAAGWADAEMLGAQWVPNVVDDSLVAPTDSAPDTDVLFFGTLRYPPNIDALERLARLWPRVQHAATGHHGVGRRRCAHRARRQTSAVRTAGRWCVTTPR